MKYLIWTFALITCMSLVGHAHAAPGDGPAWLLAMGPEHDDGKGPRRGGERDWDRDDKPRGDHAPGTAPGAGPDERRDGREGRGGIDRRPLSDEQIETAIDIVRQMHPRWAEEIDRAMEEHPDRVKQTISRNPRLRYMLDLKERNPDMFNLRIEDARLGREQQEIARKLHEALEQDNDAEADKLHGQLVTIVAEHFDVRQRIREQELEQLESRLEKLREELEQRSDARDELIDQRIEQLTEHGESPRW